MIVARAPLRLPLAGGGTDLLFYSSRFGGLLLSAAIDHYVYLVANRSAFDERISIKTRENVNVATLDELKDEIARRSENEVDPNIIVACEALTYTGIDRNIEIVFMGDISGGTGLGTSSAYIVNLMNALHHLKRNPLSPQDLAEAACHVEINMLGRPIGKQDQYMAAFGGIRTLRIDQDGTVKVATPDITQDALEELRSGLLLIYTGLKRRSGVILGEQKRLAEAGDESVVNYYHHVKDIGLRICDALESGDFVRFGYLMNEQWMEKRKLAGGVSNPEIDKMYELGIEHGAIGGKLVGAGGGGYFLFLCEPSRKRMLRAVMASHGFLAIPFSFDFQGAVLSTAFHHRYDLFPHRKIHSER